MEYRMMRFRDGEERISLLGFGCMRFPLREDGTIDEPEAERMLDRAIEAGVNYIDTAYPYHNGDSEPFVGRVLGKYPRDSYYLATKLPVWKVDSAEEAQQVFEEQLERLQVQYVDYYLLHALDQGRWNKIKELGLIEWAEKLKREGRIRHLGFSFHDSYEVFRDILTYRQWDFCQIQYNYMDRNIQAGDRGYELARKMGIPMVIMEPVKGGRLAAVSGEAETILREADETASISSWALRWVGSHENVKVILSGMSTMEQVEDNLRTFSPFKALKQEEEAAVEAAAGAIRSLVKNGCTACRYCMPCPFGVDIPGTFALWNNASMYGETEKSRAAYREKKENGESADLCRKCGKCETVCPQAISIRRDLEEAEKELSDRDITQPESPSL